jgi:hypothetical protein
MAGRMILALEIELDRAHLDAVESDLKEALDKFDIACELL